MEIKFDVKIHLSERKIQTSQKKNKFRVCLNIFLSHEETLDAKIGVEGE